MNIPIRIAVALLLTSSMSARDRSNARSMVVTRYGIVATSHVQASVAGAQILARGGSAVDAAIAANAVLGVTEPMMNGRVVVPQPRQGRKIVAQGASPGEGALTPSRRAGHPSPARAGEGTGVMGFKRIALVEN